MPVTLRKRSSIKAPNKLGFSEEKEQYNDPDDADSERSEGDLIDLDLSLEPSRRTRPPWQPTPFQLRMWAYKLDGSSTGSQTSEEITLDDLLVHSPEESQVDASEESIDVASEGGNQDVDSDSQLFHDAMMYIDKPGEGNVCQDQTDGENQDVGLDESQFFTNAMSYHKEKSEADKYQKEKSLPSIPTESSLPLAMKTDDRPTLSARGSQKQSPKSCLTYTKQGTGLRPDIPEHLATAHRVAALTNPTFPSNLERPESEPHSHLLPADRDSNNEPRNKLEEKIAKKTKDLSGEGPGSFKPHLSSLHAPSHVGEVSPVTPTTESRFSQSESHQSDQHNTLATPYGPPREFVNLRELEIFPSQELAELLLSDEETTMQAPRQLNPNELTDEEALSWIAAAEEGFYPQPELPNEAFDPDRQLSPRSSFNQFWYYPYRQRDMSRRYMKRAGPMDEVLDMETSSEEAGHDGSANVERPFGRKKKNKPPVQQEITVEQQVAPEPQTHRAPVWKELSPPVALAIFEGILAALSTEWGDEVGIVEILGLDEDDIEALAIYTKMREDQIDFEDSVAEDLQKKQIEIIKDYQAGPNARQEAEDEAMERLKSRPGPDFLRVEASKIQLGKNYLSARGMNEDYLDGWTDALAGKSSIPGWDEIFERDKQRKEREKQKTASKKRKSARKIEPAPQAIVTQTRDSEPEETLLMQAARNLARGPQKITPTIETDGNDLVGIKSPKKNSWAEEKGDTAYRPRASGTRRPNVKYVKKKAAMKGTSQRPSRLSDIVAQHKVSSGDKDTIGNKVAPAPAGDEDPNMAYMDESMKRASLTPLRGNKPTPTKQSKHKKAGTSPSQITPAGQENIGPHTSLPTRSFSATSTPEASLPAHQASTQTKAGSDDDDNNMDIDDKSSEAGEPAEGSSKPSEPRRARRSNEARRLPSRYSDDIVGDEVAAQVKKIVQKADQAAEAKDDDNDNDGNEDEDEEDEGDSIELVKYPSPTEPPAPAPAPAHEPEAPKRGRGRPRKDATPKGLSQQAGPSGGPEGAGDITVIDDYVTPSPAAPEGPPAGPPGRGQNWRRGLKGRQGMKE